MSTPFLPHLRVAIAASIFVLAGCGGGGDPVAPTPTVAVTASPASLSVVQGQSGTVQLSLVRGGGFSGAVTLATSGLPSGVTASIAPEQLTGTTSSATVTVNASAGAVPGAYSITVSASASGVGSSTSSFQLTIVAAPSFALSATPAALTVTAGSSGGASIGIARTNLPGAVALTLDAPPAGITGTFTPAAPTVDASQITVNVANTVAPGAYTLTVKGTSSGAADRTTTIALTVNPVPAITVAASPGALSLVAGTGGTSTLTLTRTNFTGDVAFTLQSPPAGISASFAPPTTSAASSVVSISVATTVAPGVYPLTVLASGTGVEPKSVALTLTVTAPPNFSLAASPTPITIAPGQNGSSTITISRVNFPGDIAFTVVSPPAGLSATFAPATTTSNSTVATVAVASNVAPGSYDLTVQGTGAGVGARTSVLRVTVPAPRQLRFHFCGDVTLQNSGYPTYFMYRDGSGEWKAPITFFDLGTLRQFSFNISSTTAAVVYTVGNVTTEVRVVTSEHDNTAPTCAGNVSFGSVTANFSGLLAGESWGVSATGSNTAIAGTAPFPRVLSTPVGLTDVWTLRQSATGGALVSDLQRGIAVPGSVNIASSSMVTATTATATLSGVLGTDNVTDYLQLQTSRGSTGAMILGFPPTVTARRIAAHPTSLASDLYSYSLEVTRQTGGFTNTLRGTYYFGNTVSDRTITVPSLVPAFTSTVASSSPVPRMRTVGTIPPEFNRVVVVQYLGASGKSYIIRASSGWLALQGATASFDLTMEDLSAAQFPQASALTLPVSTTVTLRGATFVGAAVAGGVDVTATRSDLPPTVAMPPRKR
ncbi:MAG: hypothetical protein IT353_21630 [Gemmatimonadaceae bacterium]|nr:hypothetical protein [Gemmatimonadaceae bacterium]